MILGLSLKFSRSFDRLSKLAGARPTGVELGDRSKHGAAVRTQLNQSTELAGIVPSGYTRYNYRATDFIQS